MVLAQALIVTGFVLLHVLTGKLRVLDTIPRSGWLSAAGGISVAYVFVHIFPELGEAQAQIEADQTLLPWIEHHAYLVALVGLSIFYGLESMVKSAAPGRDQEDESEPPLGGGVFWVHVVAFAAYNALIGYLLVHREEQDLRGLLFFSFAMALHFLINDDALRQHHRAPYERVGRWVLTGAIVFGWLLGLATTVADVVPDLLFALLAGSIVLNVLKEELPEERRSRFSAFALGAVAYSLLLLLL